MKRFYKDATVERTEDGWRVLLDGRPVRTPARAPLTVPDEALAKAIASEWREQGEDIDPASMVATGLANAAIDRIAPAHATFAAEIARYGETDLLCYRADDPASLVQAQIAAWNPLLDWAERRYGVTFTLATGIIHVAQPAETVARLAQAVAERNAFALAGLSTLTTMSGSLVCALALAERVFPAETVWNAAELDELWQAEQWGEDAQAAERRARRKAEFTRAAAYLDLC